MVPVWCGVLLFNTILVQVQSTNPCIIPDAGENETCDFKNNEAPFQLKTWPNATDKLLVVGCLDAHTSYTLLINNFVIDCPSGKNNLVRLPSKSDFEYNITVIRPMSLDELKFTLHAMTDGLVPSPTPPPITTQEVDAKCSGLLTGKRLQFYTNFTASLPPVFLQSSIWLRIVGNESNVRYEFYAEGMKGWENEDGPVSKDKGSAPSIINHRLQLPLFSDFDAGLYWAPFPEDGPIQIFEIQAVNSPLPEGP